MATFRKALILCILLLCSSQASSASNSNFSEVFEEETFNTSSQNLVWSYQNNVTHLAKSTILQLLRVRRNPSTTPLGHIHYSFGLVLMVKRMISTIGWANTCPKQDTSPLFYHLIGILRKHKINAFRFCICGIAWNTITSMGVSKAIPKTCVMPLTYVIGDLEDMG